MTTSIRRSRRLIHVDLTDRDVVCPHCQGVIDITNRLPGRNWGWRCTKCRCRWSGMKVLVRWGKNCPLLVRT